jgi:hypothetical protein
MMEAVKPRFEWGQRVQAAADLFNDGSYPDRPTDALLVHAGEPCTPASQARLCKLGGRSIPERPFTWSSLR